jgi:predicted ester cyclase
MKITCLQYIETSPTGSNPQGGDLMSIGENKTLLLRYIEAVWEQRNPHAARGFLAHDYKRQVSPTSKPLTRDEQIQRLVGFRAAFPDIQITVEEVVAEGHWISFRSRMRGTHLGEFLGRPPTGKQVEVILLDMIRIEDGQFIEHWGGPDLFDLLRQLDA